jgi:hypothetical protein
LGGAGATELREIDRGFLFFQQRIGSTSPVKVAIVTVKSLDAHIEECTRVSDALMALFEPAVRNSGRKAGTSPE